MEKFKVYIIRTIIISAHTQLKIFTRFRIGKNYKLIILLHLKLHINSIVYLDYFEYL